MLLALSVILLISYACKKKAEPEPESPAAPVNTTPTSNIDQFFTSNAAVPQTFTINANTAQTITGSKGTVITIPKNAFVIANTTSVVSTGTVEMTLKEIYTKKDMFLNSVQTMAGNDFLESGGELNITAKQGSNNLKLAAGKKIKIAAPTGSLASTSMQTFYGSLNSAGQMNWAVNTNSAVIPTNTSSSVTYYSFYADSLHWINIDKISCTTCPVLTFTVNLSGSFNKTNTKLATVLPSVNGLLGLAPVFSTQSFYGSAKIPNNSNATIVAISEIGGQYYSSFQPVTATPGATYNLTMTPTTTTQIHTQLNGL